MTTLKANLHEAQMRIFKSDARFKIVCAGRRFGKSYLSCWILLTKALQSTNKDVAYIAPTFDMAKKIMWEELKRLGKDVIKQAHENTAVLTLVNGRKIRLLGGDRPDTLRGLGYAYAVIDEYGFIKPSVWELAVRPTLADVKGGCLFIGTPSGKNHFYDLFMESQNDPDWECWQFNSTDNPFLDPKEIDVARKTMSSAAFRQEFEASFESFSGGIFQEEWIKYSDEAPKDGANYIAVDPAGFEDVAKEQGNKKQRLDETAIAVVNVSPNGWYVLEIIHGRWNVRETSIRILRAAQKYNVMAVGIERGSLKNALTPYLEDQMRRLSFYPRIEDLTHGGKKKTERITWALQGRFEHGRITLNRGEWNRPFVNQLLDFPNPMSHDDMPDCLAYIDQVAVADYSQSFDVEEWEPIDLTSGY